MTLRELTAQLEAAYGSALCAVVLYGSAARDAAAPDVGPHDLLVIVETLGMHELRRVAPTVRAWREAGHPAPLTLTAREWRSSADVFPMEYAEVLDAHRVLAGVLPVDGISVDPGDLRRQLELQVLGALLRLRAGVLASGNDASQLVALLAAIRSTVLVFFRTLARLHGADPFDAEPALADWAGRVAGFDPAPFHRVLARTSHPGRGSPGRESSGRGISERPAHIPVGEAPVLVEGCLVMLERLGAHVDALHVGPAGRLAKRPAA